MKKFNRVIAFLLVLCMVLSVAPAMSIARAADADADLWIDPVNGNDANDGTTEATALKTINAAKTKAAELSANGDVVVILKEGTYDATETITFGAAESGKNGNTITYRAASGETALISGGEQLDGWTLHDAAHNIYVTDIPKGAELIRQFYVDGEPQPMASMELTPQDLHVFNSYGYRSGIIAGADYTHYLTVDLGEGKLVSNVTLYGDPEASATTGKAMGFPEDFTIQTSADGYTWTTQVTETGFTAPNALGGVEFNFSSTAARYIKIEATKLGNPATNSQSGGIQHRLAFSEVQVGFTSKANSVNLGIAQHVDLTSSIASASNVSLTTNNPYVVTLGSSATAVGAIELTSSITGTTDNIKIQATTDGTNWKTIYSKNGYTWKQSNVFAFNPVIATKIRVISAQNITVNQLKVYKPAEIAGTVTATGTNANKLMDNKFDGGFKSNNQVSSIYEGDITINLGSVQDVGAVRLYPTYNGKVPTGYMTSARIQVSTDGVTYHTVSEMPSIQTPTGGAQILVLPKGYQAQYVKIQPLMMTGEGEYSLHLDEIDVVPSTIDGILAENDNPVYITKKLYNQISMTGATPTLGYYTNGNTNASITEYSAGEEEAGCVIDGNRSYGYTSTFTYNELVQWGGSKIPSFLLELGAATEVGAIEIAIDPDIWSAPLKFDLQVYTNGAWKTVATEDDPQWIDKTKPNAHYVERYDFDPVTITAARILVYNLTMQNGTYPESSISANPAGYTTDFCLNEFTLFSVNEITYKQEEELNSATTVFDKVTLTSSSILGLGYYAGTTLESFTSFNDGSASKIIDGSYDTYGATHGQQYQWMPPYGPNIPALILNAAKGTKPSKINAIELAVREDGLCAPYDFMIQVTTSPDKDNWTTVAQVEEMNWTTNNKVTFKFPEMDVYKVRLVATLLTPASNIPEEQWKEAVTTYMHISELSLYNIYDPENPVAQDLVSQGEGTSGDITYDARGAKASSDNSSTQYKALRAIDGFIEPLDNAGLFANGDTKYYFSYLKNPENVEMHSLYLWYHRIQHFSSASLDGTELYSVDGLGARSDEVIMPTWLSNDYLFLDCPGEWYIDRNEGKIYYMADGTMDGKTAILPVTDKIVDMEYANNITFEGITFSHTSWTYPSTNEYRDQQANGYLVGNSWQQVPAGVDLTGCKNVTFDGCQIRNMGTAGIRIKSDGTVISDGCKIINSVVCDISYSGIVVGEIVAHHGYRDWQLVKNATVQNNLVTRIGIDMFDSVGIFVAYTNGAVIDHNEVAYTPYSGISLGWGWDEEEKNNSNALTQVGNNKVTNNFVHDVCRTVYDGGAIYTLGWQEGSVISGNYIYNSGSSATKTENAIYLDEGSAYIQVTGNVIDSAAQSWLQIYFSNIHDNTVTGNYYRSGLSTRGAFVNIGNTTRNNTSFSSVSGNAQAKAIADASGLTDNAFEATEKKGFVRQHDIALEFWGSTDGARYTPDCPGWYNVHITGQVGRTYYNNVDNIVTIVMPEGTDLSALTLQYSNYSNWSTSPVSSTTGDFTNPVTYTTTGSTGSKTWTVKVIEEPDDSLIPAPPVNDDPTVETVPTVPTEPAGTMQQIDLTGTVVGFDSQNSASESDFTKFTWYSTLNPGWKDLTIPVDGDYSNHVYWGVDPHERSDMALDLTRINTNGVLASQLKLYHSMYKDVPSLVVILKLADGTFVEKTFTLGWQEGVEAEPFVYTFDETYTVTGVYLWENQNVNIRAAFGEVELFYRTGDSSTTTPTVPTTPPATEPTEPPATEPLVGTALKVVSPTKLTTVFGCYTDGTGANEATFSDGNDGYCVTDGWFGRAGYSERTPAQGKVALIMTLNETMTLGGLELTGNNTSNDPTKFDVQAYVNGAWVTVYSQNGNPFTSTIRTVMCEFNQTVTTNKVRVLVHEISGGTSVDCRLQEAVLYAASDKYAANLDLTGKGTSTDANASNPVGNLVDNSKDSIFLGSNATFSFGSTAVKVDGFRLFAYRGNNTYPSNVKVEIQTAPGGGYTSIGSFSTGFSNSYPLPIMDVDFGQTYEIYGIKFSFGTWGYLNGLELYQYVEAPVEEVPLSAPTGLTEVTVTSDSLTVTADSVTGGTLKFRLLDDSNNVVADWQTSGTFTGLSPYTKYYAEAMYVGGVGYIDSPAISIQVRTGKLQLPDVTGLRVVTISRDSVTVTADSHANGTLRYRLLDSDGNSVKSWTTGNTFTGLTAGTTYIVEAQYRGTGAYTTSANFTRITITTESEPAPAQFGVSYSVRLIEPWALRTYLTFASAPEQPIGLANIKSYGAYAIIEHKFEGTTVEDLMADADAAVYTSAAGNITAFDANTVVFDFSDEIYTHRMGEKVYWVAYYEDMNGDIHYTGLESTTIVEVAQTVAGQGNVSTEQKAVLNSMQTLKDAVVDFRGEDVGNVEYPAGNTVAGSGITFGAGGDPTKYHFGTSHRIRLIEPWSINVTAVVLDVAQNARLDYNAANVDYGMIFYHDKTGATTTMTLEQILAADGTAVYSKSNGNASILANNINVIYDKGIYTNELDTNLYCVPFVIVDGQIYYCPVITWNLHTEMETFAANTELDAKEIAVFEAMLELHENTVAYYATVD